MLLVGCGGSPESSETSEKPEYTASATTTSAATTTAATSATEPVIIEPQSTEGGQLAGGVVLAEEHKELKSALMGAGGYCDFDELGVDIAVYDDILQETGENADDPKYSEVIGIDDGCLYFQISTVSLLENPEYPESPESDNREYRYFCFDSDSGELTEIYPCDGYSYIVGVSNEVMVCEQEGSFIAVRRDTGFSYKLPDNVSQTATYNSEYLIVKNETVYYSYVEYGSQHLCFFTLNKSAVGDTTDLSVMYDISGLRRGVGNIISVDFSEDIYRSLGGGSYINYDPHGRIKDYVTETYYHGYGAVEKTVLGWRIRISIADKNGKEYVLGYVNMQEQPNLNHSVSGHFDMHAAKNGIVLLIPQNTQSIAMLGEENDFSGAKAAFLPDNVLPENYDVYCDEDRVYLFDTWNCKRLVVLSKREQ